MKSKKSDKKPPKKPTKYDTSIKVDASFDELLSKAIDTPVKNSKINKK